ncbi:MAG: hypothetical protein ACSHXD_09510 [Marinosulfonomonas sp.]
MNFSKTLSFAVAAAICLAPSIGSAATHYSCKVLDNSGWIAPEIDILYDEATGAVEVHDYIIYDSNGGKPMSGKVLSNNKKKISFGWVIEGAKSSQGQYVSNFKYRASYLKPKKQFIVTAKPLGYSNDFRAKGTCVLSTVK